MATPERNIEELELDLRKLARGEVPAEGDVLIRRNNKWVFSSSIPSAAGLQFPGDGGTTTKDLNPTGATGFIKLVGRGGSDPDAVIYEIQRIVGSPTGFTIDEVDGELVVVSPGLFVLNGSLTYENLMQAADLHIVIDRGGFIIVVAGGQANVGGGGIGFINVSVTLFLEVGDKIFLEFGRSDGVVFSADCIRADFFAYVLGFRQI